MFAAPVVLGRGLRDLPGARPGRQQAGVRRPQAADAAAAAALLQLQEQPAVPQRAQRAGARRHGATAVGAIHRLRRRRPAVEQPGGAALLLDAQPHQGQFRERAAARKSRLRRQPALSSAAAPTAAAAPPTDGPKGRCPGQAAKVPLNTSITCKYFFLLLKN